MWFLNQNTLNKEMINCNYRILNYNHVTDYILIPNQQSWNIRHEKYLFGGGGENIYIFIFKLIKQKINT